jgi:N-acetylmuramoyl-L-alanine amidase
MGVKIVFHCSGSSFGNAALIAKWHVLPKPNGRGWTGIGYHYVILNGWLASQLYNDSFDGYLETGRPLNDDPFISKSEIGAHVLGHNTNSVGICLIGKSGTFTDKQLNKALKVVYNLEKQFGPVELFQHSDLDKKKPFCAGLDMEKLKRNYQIYKGARDSGQSM